jgi:hypothetical protein
MASSGSSDFSLNVRELATSALGLIGVVGIGDTPTDDEMDKALLHLNLMVKTWGAMPSPKLWLLTEGSQALTASTASYTLTAARKVLSVRRRTSSIDTPLLEMSRSDYFDTPSKASTGMATSYYFDPQRATRTLYVWPVPDATIAASTTLQYTYLRVIEDLDALTDDFDLPQEWLEAIQYGLAARLTVPFRMHLTDPAGAAEIKQRAADLYAQLASYDTESASIFFQPA